MDRIHVREYVHKWVASCEMLYGQPREYYDAEIELGEVKPFSTQRYHLVMSGLNRKVYRSAFGIDAFSYSDSFRIL